jgi:hypothetical protein
MFGPPPEGLGEFKSWMIKVSVAFGVAMLGMGVAVVAVPIMINRTGWAAYAPIPLNGLIACYFVWWIPTHRRVMRRVRDAEGQLCWNCSYPGPTGVGSVCAECGHVHTQRNINELMNGLSGVWPRNPRNFNRPPKDSAAAADAVD